MDCGACGLTGRNWDTVCENCGNVLQDDESAREKRRQWDNLPGEAREEFEKEYRKGRERFDAYHAWLRRTRILHSVFGALIVGFFMNLALQFAFFWTIPIHMLVGAAAALRLNWGKGGAYRGLGLFVLAGIVCVALNFPFAGANWFWRGGFLLSSLSFMFLAGAGYYMGLKLEWSHFEI